MAVRELPESGLSINTSDYVVIMEKLTREKQRLTGPVKAKGLRLQTISGLVEDASRLREKRSKAKEDEDRLSAEKKVALALVTEISELKRTDGFLVGFLQKIKDRAVETEMDLEKTQDGVAVSESPRTSLTDKFASLSEELPSIRTKRANLESDLDERTALVQRPKEDARK